jgi:predicted amidohydrolase
VGLALLYGAVSSSAAPATVLACAFVPSNRMAELDALTNRPAYDEETWTAYLGRLAEDMQRASQKHVTAKAIDRTDEERSVELTVWPEAAVVLNDATREAFFKRLAGIASGTGCVQVAAYYDWDRMESSAVIAAGREDIGAPYSRRHFVPRVDDVFVPSQIASPGLSAPSPTPTGIGSVGALLSFDANFFQNFRSIAKGGGQIACVCGLDDEKMPEISLRLLVYNAAMSGLAVVRSARNGLMAAISPDGEIIARDRTSRTADTTLLARVPLGEADTPFLSVGNAFGWLALLAGLGCGFYAATLREPATPGARREEPAGSGPISYKTREGIKRL